MKKIVLVYPRTGFDKIRRVVDLPLSLLTVASTVKDDYCVRIIDQRIDDRWRSHLQEELAGEPLCVGISAMTGNQIAYGLEVAKAVKSYNASHSRAIKVVWGGIHGTLLPEQTTENENIDILVMGEGEITFRELVKALDGGGSLSAIEGIVYKENGKVIRNAEREKVPLEDLPPIPYDLVNIEHYVNSKAMITENVKRVLPVISSRGCPYQCTYCCNPRLSRHRWRALSAENTYELASTLVDRYHLNGIVFHDENFLSDPVRAMKIAELIDNRFAWSIQGRMDSILDIDVKRLSRLGLRMVQPGIESGSDKILKLIRKGEDRKTMEMANLKLAETDIKAVYNFMIGLPQEEYDNILETVDFALKLLDDNSNVEISGFYILVPYPGTEIFQVAVEQGFVPPKSLEEWALFDRQHNETPWVKDKVTLLNNLMMSSKFVDSERMVKLIGNPLLAFPFWLLGLYYRNMWRRHRFDSLITRILIGFFRAEMRNQKRTC